ncbi:MAG: OmpA family protein [Proteobacteria bacterium]|nr:OmpA family protein [Pseudomonadota bacterium]MBS0572939.1 OmpA family protein [Pseudomonadota bacterium]
MRGARTRLCRAGLLCLALSLPAAAQGADRPAAPSLTLPRGATETARTRSAFAALRLPVGRWTAGHMPMVDLRGGVEQTAWRIADSDTGTLALITGLAAQLADAGFSPIFACATDDCGGFDFRYAAPILPEPEMHVDLGDFQYQVMIRGRGDQADYAALIASRSGETAFAELIYVAQAGAPPPTPPPASTPAPAPSPQAEPASAPFATRIEAEGHVVLDDLAFASGSADLAAGPSAALSDLAAYLAAHPAARVTIVGHTDSSGNAAANRDLSRARARSVMARLIADYGVAPAQLSADGIGALAPLTTNLTETGRQKNRRVEAVLTSTR